MRMPVAHVATGEAGEVAIRAGAPCVAGICALVGTERDPRLRQAEPDVVSAHQERPRADAAVIFDDQVDDGVLRAAIASLAVSASVRPDSGFSFLGIEAAQAIGRAGEEAQVLPAIARLRHLAYDAGADGRILQAFDPRIQAPFLDRQVPSPTTAC